MNVPKIRFSNFNGEWINQKLKDISNDISYGMNSASKDFDGKNAYIRITDIDENTGKFNKNNLVSPDGALEDKFLVKDNDILFARTGASTGKTYLYNADDGKLYYAGFLIKANIKNEYNSNFIYQQTKTNKYNKWVKIMSMRSGQPGINSEEYGSFYFSITSKQEQDKISKLFEMLDKKIELQSKKIEALKLYKKGLFTKIKDLNCKENIELKELAKFENGKGHESLVSEDGNYILINSKFISTNGSIIKKCTSQLTPLIKNDIVMVMSDLPNGKALAKCFFIDEDNKYSLNQRICSLRINSNINAKYIFYKISRNPYYLKFDDKVNQTNLKKEDVLGIIIPIPDLETQNKVANIMSIIDKKISKENLKFLNIVELKKGLMQNMFV